MNYTLTIKKNRILKCILKKGKYFASKYIVVHYMNNSEDISKNFLGICVSKKNGISVHRNKLKRWAREIYKNEEQFLKRGKSIIILFKKTTTINNVDFYIIKNDIVKCFKELDLYEKNKEIF